MDKYTELDIEKLRKHFGTEQLSLEYANDHSYELNYVYEHGYDLCDFDGWCCVNNILGESITWSEFKEIDNVLMERDIETNGLTEEKVSKEELRSILAGN